MDSLREHIKIKILLTDIIMKIIKKNYRFLIKPNSDTPYK